MSDQERPGTRAIVKPNDSMRDRTFAIPIRRWSLWTLGLAVVWLCSVVCAQQAQQAQQTQQATQPKDEKEEEIEYYQGVRSYVDQTLFELGWNIPELINVAPPSSLEDDQKAETQLLDLVGEKVKEFVEDFPGASANEEITMQQLWPNGKVVASKTRTFRYVIVRQGEGERSSLHEYRADQAGKPEEPWGLYKGFRPTTGFASTVVQFYPLARSDALFRYLGKETIAGKETDVVAFAQRPGFTQVAGRVELGREKSIRMLLQGLAWVDPASRQMVRLRTDLLAPLVEAGLFRYTTDVRFHEVRFGETSKARWLPVEATVTTERNSAIYRNIHRFSDYALVGH